MHIHQARGVHGQGILEKREAAGREKQAERSAEKCQQNAFGDQLGDDAPRPAPSAERMAISFSRVAARERVRSATLAQAIKSTSATAPNNINSLARTSETMPLRNRTTSTWAFHVAGIGHGKIAPTCD